MKSPRKGHPYLSPRVWLPPRRFSNVPVPAARGDPLRRVWPIKTPIHDENRPFLRRVSIRARDFVEPARISALLQQQRQSKGPKANLSIFYLKKCLKQFFFNYLWEFFKSRTLRFHDDYTRGLTRYNSIRYY